jgi:hypothetical protein
MTSRTTFAGSTLRFPKISPIAHDRARHLAFALIAVALIFVGRRILGGSTDGAEAFLLFDAAIAVSVLQGGIVAGLVAVLAAALLGFRELADREISTLSAVLQFAVQGVAVASIVAWLQRDRVRLQKAFGAERQALEQTREVMSVLELQHGAASRDMWERHERFRVTSTAERDAMLGQLDATNGQLQRLETLTDPALSELPTWSVLNELLARVRTALDADSAVLVDARDRDRPLVLGGDAGHLSVRRDTLRRATAPGQRPTRVHLVQNDPVRLADTSVIAWRDEVATLVSVPVACAGTILGVIEIAMRRARRWTDWDTALLRIVADRAAWVLMSPTTLEAREKVAVSNQQA